MTTLAIALALATPALAQRPAMPRVRSQPCDRYCQVKWGTCKRVVLRATPSERAPVAGLIDSGHIVRVVDGRRITTRPGVVVVRGTHTLTEKLDGDEGPVALEHPRHWRLTRGDTVYVVDVETDGDSHANYIWTYRGREDTTAAFWNNASSPPEPSAKVQMVEPMEQAWWARVVSGSGVIGWTTRSSAWTGTSYDDDPLSKCVTGARSR